MNGWIKEWIKKKKNSKPRFLAQRIADYWNISYSENDTLYTERISNFFLALVSHNQIEVIGSDIPTNIIPLFQSIQWHFQLCSNVE